MDFAEATGIGLPTFSAGAHLDFELPGYGLRSYSLIDWSAQRQSADVYTVAVQIEDEGSGGSKAMHEMQLGQAIQATAPSNDFELLDGSAPVLLLGGGIGITPLISMAVQLISQGRNFSLHYSARTKAAMGFRETLLNALGDHVHFYFDDSKPLNLTTLMTAQPSTTDLYICGPKGMIDTAINEAVNAGLAETNIHVELFSAAASSATDAPFEVEIKNTGEVFVIPAGQSIIEVLEAAGKDLMFDCQRGDCGICQTDVISGIPDHRDVVLSKADHDSGKVMQICVSRALSGRLVLDL